jgi:cyanophycin synthetase
VVALRATANLFTGGTAIGRTGSIHPHNVAIAERAAAIIGLDTAGLDFVTPDISRPVRETGGGIIELNAAPGLRMHIASSEGAPRNVAQPIIAMLFPGRATGWIPIIAITGTNGESTTGRMVKHILRQAGLCVGLTNSGGVMINETIAQTGDATGQGSARLVHGDPTVDLAVLETARGGMLREGLGFERADIGCAGNVPSDHLGLGGSENLSDLARLKSLIVKVVHRWATSVLNWDNPRTHAMAHSAGGELVWFSLRGGPQMAGGLARHIGAGHAVVVRESGPHGGEIVVCGAQGRERVMGAPEIPATIDGQAEFNITNALAAIAIARAQGGTDRDDPTRAEHLSVQFRTQPRSPERGRRWRRALHTRLWS